MAKSWEDKYSILKNDEFRYSNEKNWKMQLEEDKTKGTLQLNVRCWTESTTENGYNGPSKNGFIIPITSEEDFNKIIACMKQIAEFAESCKEFI